MAKRHTVGSNMCVIVSHLASVIVVDSCFLTALNRGPLSVARQKCTQPSPPRLIFY